MALPVIKLALGVLFTFFPFLKTWVRKGGAAVAALTLLFNPINLFNWFVLGLTTILLMIINPFKIFGKQQLSFWELLKKSMLWSLVALIPLFLFYYFVLADIVLKIVLEVAT